MKTKLQKVTGTIGLLLGGLIILTPFHLAPVCQRLLELKTGRLVHMRCHYTGQAEVYLGIAVLLTSLFFLLAQGSGARKALGKVWAVLGLLVLLLPTKYGIGVCLSPMECWTTRIVLYVLGGLVVANGLAVHLEKDRAADATSGERRAHLSSAP
ncbi:DUF4418 family protein [Thermanaeromonas sp. C210]|uniref:DUF4418 family protein n=1 Tax=Thermanaeromonas sp. C210 TaxID=2731925 RepID=UPI00155CC2FA|nr:DUF4418 family protein [Thermanaeromonas sp. C210]GFN22841.1 hypothetical protein TAMC210_11580 [Thermanaeromonas sp. C210]